MSFSSLSYFSHLTRNHSQCASSPHVENHLALRKIKMLQKQLLLIEDFTVFNLSHPLIPVSHMLSILMETWLGFAVASTCSHSHLKVSEFQGTDSLSPERWWVTVHGQQWDFAALD